MRSRARRRKKRQALASLLCSVSNSPKGEKKKKNSAVRVSLSVFQKRYRGRKVATLSGVLRRGGGRRKKGESAAVSCRRCQLWGKEKGRGVKSLGAFVLNHPSPPIGTGEGVANLSSLCQIRTKRPPHTKQRTSKKKKKVAFSVCRRGKKKKRRKARYRLRWLKCLRREANKKGGKGKSQP